MHLIGDRAMLIELGKCVVKLCLQYMKVYSVQFLCLDVLHLVSDQVLLLS